MDIGIVSLSLYGNDCKLPIGKSQPFQFAARIKPQLLATIAAQALVPMHETRVFGAVVAILRKYESGARN